MTPRIPKDSAAKRLAAYSYLVAFANDGTLDEAELAMLEKLALEDGVVDDAEKQVLENIFNRVGKDKVTEAVWNHIEEFKEDHGID